MDADVSLSVYCFGPIQFETLYLSLRGRFPEAPIVAQSTSYTIQENLKIRKSKNKLHTLR